MLIRSLLVLTIFATGCTAAGPATLLPQRTAVWGPEVKGLRARFMAPAEIEQNAPLAVAFELRWDPGAVPVGITGFDRYFADTRLRLTLTNMATGRADEIGPYEFDGPSPGPNRGQYVSPLDGTAIKPITTKFPLRAAGERLEPGMYDCVVSYASERGYRGYTKGQSPKGLWRGELRTAPMRLIVKPEVLRPVTFLVPRRLRLTRDLKVVYLPEDTDRVTAMLGNGMYVGTRIVCHSGSQEVFQELDGGPPPQPDGPIPIDDWHPGESRLADGQAQYTIEVLATADPPHHMWGPEPGFDDYKTLWKKQFVVRR
jgi:hypothetical protein